MQGCVNWGNDGQHLFATLRRSVVFWGNESKLVAKLAQSDMIGENHIVTLSGMMKYCYFVGNGEVLQVNIKENHMLVFERSGSCGN